MAIELEYEDANLVIIRGSGVVKRAEADEIKRQVVALIHRYGNINVLIMIEEGFSNLEAFVDWSDDHDDEFIQKHVNRMAIVGDLKWRDSALLFFLKGYLPFSIEYFKAGQEEFARAWLIQTG
jgi:hypothetical protein